MDRHKRAAEQAARSRIAEQNRRTTELRDSIDRRRSEERRRSEDLRRQQGRSGSGRVDVSFSDPHATGRASSRGMSVPAGLDRRQVASQSIRSNSAESGSRQGSLAAPSAGPRRPSLDVEACDYPDGQQPSPQATVLPNQLNKRLAYLDQPIGSPGSASGNRPTLGRLSATGLPSADPPPGSLLAARQGLAPSESDGRSNSGLSGSARGRSLERDEFSFVPARGRGRSSQQAVQVFRLTSQNDALRNNVQQLRQRNRSLQEQVQRGGSGDQRARRLQQHLDTYDRVMTAMADETDPNALRAGFMQLASLRRIAVARAEDRPTQDIMSTWPRLQSTAFYDRAQTAAGDTDTTTASQGSGRGSPAASLADGLPPVRAGSR